MSKPYETKLFDPFEISFSTNASTGASLHILLSPNLELISSEYKPSRRSSVPGSSRTKKFLIQGIKPGTGYVALFNHRVWESPDRISPTFYHINIVE